MTYYIAGWYDAKDRLTRMMREVEKRGHTVTSGWLQQTEPGGVGMPPLEVAKMYATRDIFDIARAQAIIYDTFDESIRQARTVEWGIAIGMRKYRILVGPGVMPGVFKTSAHETYESWDALFAKWDAVAAGVARLDAERQRNADLARRDAAAPSAPTVSLSTRAKRRAFVSNA